MMWANEKYKLYKRRKRESPTSVQNCTGIHIHTLGQCGQNFPTVFVFMLELWKFVYPKHSM